MDCSKINGLRFAVVCIDNCDTGVAQRSVDRLVRAFTEMLKSTAMRFNTESTNSKITVLLARRNQWTHRPTKTVRLFVVIMATVFAMLASQSVIFRNDKRIEPDRDSRFGTEKAIFRSASKSKTNALRILINFKGNWV